MRITKMPPPCQSAMSVLVETTNPNTRDEALTCTTLLGSVRDCTTVSFPFATLTTSSASVVTPNGCGVETECAKNPFGANVLVGLTTVRVDRLSPVPNVMFPGGLGVAVGVGLGVGVPAAAPDADGDGCC